MAAVEVRYIRNSNLIGLAIFLGVVGVTGLVLNVGLFFLCSVYRSTRSLSVGKYIMTQAAVHVLLCVIVVPYSVLYEFRMVQTHLSCVVLEYLRHFLILSSTVYQCATAALCYCHVRFAKGGEKSVLDRGFTQYVLLTALLCSALSCISPLLYIPWRQASATSPLRHHPNVIIGTDVSRRVAPGDATGALEFCHFSTRLTGYKVANAYEILLVTILLLCVCFTLFFFVLTYMKTRQQPTTAEEYNKNSNSATTNGDGGSAAYTPLTLPFSPSPRRDLDPYTCARLLGAAALSAFCWLVTVVDMLAGQDILLFRYFHLLPLLLYPVTLVLGNLRLIRGAFGLGDTEDDAPMRIFLGLRKPATGTSATANMLTGIRRPGFVDRCFGRKSESQADTELPESAKTEKGGLYRFPDRIVTPKDDVDGRLVEETKLCETDTGKTSADEPALMQLTGTLSASTRKTARQDGRKKSTDGEAEEDTLTQTQQPRKEKRGPQHDPSPKPSSETLRSGATAVLVEYGKGPGGMKGGKKAGQQELFVIPDNPD